MPENTLYLLDNGSVLYNSTSDIAGFQFDIMGACAPEGGSGGAAEYAGLTVSGGSIPPCTVLGVSFTGAIIPAGCGTLTTLVLEECSQYDNSNCEESACCEHYAWCTWDDNGTPEDNNDDICVGDANATGLSDIVFSNPDAESFILTYCTEE